MKNAESHSWSVVFSGVERLDMSTAFRGSRWAQTWYEHSSLVEDHDPDSGRIVTIPLKSLDDLSEILTLCKGVRPAWGTQLCLSGEFGATNVSATLCSSGTAYLESSCVMHARQAAIDAGVVAKIGELETGLHDLKQMLAMKVDCS